MKSRYSIYALMLVVAVCAFFMNNSAYAQDRSQKVKAVFLFKFVGYITWPDKRSSTTICTYGGNPFGNLLNQLSGLQKQSVTIKNINSGQSILGCHIVYVSPSVSSPNTNGQAIITVSESSGFAQKRGMIELKETSERIQLIINVARLKAANLKASSRLLDIAELIR